MSHDPGEMVLRLNEAREGVHHLRFAPHPKELAKEASDAVRNSLIDDLLATKRECLRRLAAAESALEALPARVPAALRAGGLNSAYASVLRALRRMINSLGSPTTSPGHGKMPLRGWDQPGGDQAAEDWERAELQVGQFTEDLRLARLLEAAEAAPPPPPPEPVAAPGDPLSRAMPAEHIATVREFRLPYDPAGTRRWRATSQNRHGKVMTQSVSGPRTAIEVVTSLLNSLVIPEDRRAEEAGDLPPQWRLTKLSFTPRDGEEVVVFPPAPPSPERDDILDLDNLPELSEAELQAAWVEAKAAQKEFQRLFARPEPLVYDPIPEHWRGRESEYERRRGEMRADPRWAVLLERLAANGGRGHDDAVLEAIHELQREYGLRGAPPTGGEPPSDETSVNQLAATAPPLDTGNGEWVTNKVAATLEGVTAGTLSDYRGRGINTADGMLGKDNAGRIWRRQGTKTSHPWYYRPSLRSSPQKK
ncbi:MAG TPA: hypothetical protein VF796_04525 [Humisphaera sp.]